MPKSTTTQKTQTKLELFYIYYLQHYNTIRTTIQCTIPSKFLHVGTVGDLYWVYYLINLAWLINFIHSVWPQPKWRDCVPLFYVLPCVILFLCFSVLLVLRLHRLGKRGLILVLFVRLFDLCLFGFAGFLFLLGSGKGCGLWLWHSLDFSLTFFCSVSQSVFI